MLEWNKFYPMFRVGDFSYLQSLYDYLKDTGSELRTDTCITNTCSELRADLIPFIKMVFAVRHPADSFKDVDWFGFYIRLGELGFLRFRYYGVGPVSASVSLTPGAGNLLGLIGEDGFEDVTLEELRNFCDSLFIAELSLRDKLKSVSSFGLPEAVVQAVCSGIISEVFS